MNSDKPLTALCQLSYRLITRRDGFEPPTTGSKGEVSLSIASPAPSTNLHSPQLLCGNLLVKQWFHIGLPSLVASS